MEDKNLYQPILEQILQMVIEEEEEEFDLHDLFQPASEDYIAVLKRLGIADRVLNFYETFAPTQIIDSSESDQLYDLRSILTFNLNSSPGMYLVPYGMLVIGQNSGGDGFCLRRYEKRNDKDMSVYMVPVSANFESQEKVDSLVIKIADTFGEFLTNYSIGKLPFDYYQAKES